MNAFFNQVLTKELGPEGTDWRAGKTSSKPEYTALGKTVLEM